MSSDGYGPGRSNLRELREREQNMQIRRNNGLFDELKRMAHSSAVMKRIGILLATVMCGFTTLAQGTNTSAADGPVYSTMPALSNSAPLHIPTTTNGSVLERWMSLQDCIAIALEHNFTIQIARYNPQIARYNLWGSYGVYDPNFSASVNHTYNLSPGGVDAQGRPFVGSESESDNLQAGLQGLLPWGLSYNLGGSANDQTVTRSTSLIGTNIVGFSTNTFFDTSTNPIVFLSPRFNTHHGAHPF